MRVPGEHRSRRSWPPANLGLDSIPSADRRALTAGSSATRPGLILSLSCSLPVWDGPFRTAGESGWALQSPAVSDNAQNLNPTGAGGARGPGESVSRVLCARTPAATCRCGGRMGKLATFCSHQPSAKLFLLLPSELARVGPHPRPGGALRCLRVSC